MNFMANTSKQRFNGGLTETTLWMNAQLNYNVTGRAANNDYQVWIATKWI